MNSLIEFESLAAKKKLEKDSEFYLSLLENALNKEENKNIAITGGYGAGKTTIIDAYFNKYKEKDKRMMRVAIATFNAEEDNFSQNENLLEQQILQQMIYQVNPNLIVNSRFIKISDLSFWYIFSMLIFLLGTIVYTILMINNNWLKDIHLYIIEFAGKGHVTNFLIGLVYIIHIIIYGSAIYLLLMFFRKLGVSKFGVANTNIEFNFTDGSTVFNHYLDEIIYLFKKSKKQYIVFEDLDRFQNVKIFERLRSLNTTLNNSAQLKNLNIKFIYALKDDIFANEDESEKVYNRTKFFDFIIPTVKVIHSSNAESFLLKKLENILSKKDNMYDDENNQKLSTELIEDVALFISDMRTLINICNEFEVYRLRLKDSSITYNHLFAFVVYKNMYPKDYSNLLENKGIVYSVFNNREEIISNLEKEIKYLKEISINAIGDVITTKDDISILFAKKRNLLNKVLKQEGNIILDLNEYNNNLKNVGERVFNFILNNGIDGEFGIYHKDNYQNNKLIKSYSNIDEFVTINSVNYLKLYSDFEQNLIRNKEEINSQIQLLEQKIKHVYTKSISRLIKEDGIQLNIDFSNKELLYFLIKENWLNESYEDYLTVFREGALSKKDNEFIKSIKLGRNRENLHFPIEKVEKISSKVRVDDINSIAVINIKFIKYLLMNDSDENNEKISKVIDVLFGQLSQFHKEYLILLNELEEESLAGKFLEKSILKGIDVWKDVNRFKLTLEQKNNYALILIKNCNPDILISIESINDFRNFISYDLDVRLLTESSNMYNVLSKLGIKFNSLVGISETVLDQITEICCYQINLSNLREIFKTNTISIGLIQSNSVVNKYCMNNSRILIQDVLMKQDNYQENEEIFSNFIKYIVENIDDNNVDYEGVDKLIVHWKGRINDLTKIDSIEVVQKLYEFKKFELTWDNIEYGKNVLEENDYNFEINHILSNDLDWKNLVNYSSKSIQDKYQDNEKYNDFVNFILGYNALCHNSIREFINQLHYPVKLENYSELSKELIYQLIDNEILEWDADIYLELNSREHKEKFVIDNIQTSESDLDKLIENNELEWSLYIFELLYERQNLDLKIIQAYIKNRIEEIDQSDFNSLLERRLIEYDEELLRKLLASRSNNMELLVDYLIYLMLIGYKSQVYDIVQAYEISWNEKLFNELFDYDVDCASVYLLDNPDKVESLSLNQDLFESIIKNSDDIGFNLSIINRYYKQLEISSVISEKVFENLCIDTDRVLRNLENNAVIKIIQFLPLEKASKLIFEFLNFTGIGREEIYRILPNLQTPFNNVKRNGKNFEISERNENVEELLNYFKSVEVIYKFEHTDKGYLVRNKRK